MGRPFITGRGSPNRQPIIIGCGRTPWPMPLGYYAFDNDWWCPHSCPGCHPPNLAPRHLGSSQMEIQGFFRWKSLVCQSIHWFLWGRLKSWTLTPAKVCCFSSLPFLSSASLPLFIEVMWKNYNGFCLSWFWTNSAFPGSYSLPHFAEWCHIWSLWSTFY